MTDFAFAPPATPSAAISRSEQRFPIHRVYCVGRNYAEHVREMGGDTEREAPVFFTKPADAVIANDAAIPYPPRTANLHHEIELVIAIGRGGRDIHKDRLVDWPGVLDAIHAPREPAPPVWSGCTKVGGSPSGLHPSFPSRH